tara:strand:+ start:593 stop:697 length:105 start_codon:yes stop_codon:yes gene_type:complete
MLEKENKNHYLLANEIYHPAVIKRKRAQKIGLTP